MRMRRPDDAGRSDTFLAVDLGAESGRVMLGSLAGGRLQLDGAAPLRQRAGPTRARRCDGISRGSWRRSNAAFASARRRPASEHRRHLREQLGRGLRPAGRTRRRSSKTPTTTATARPTACSTRRSAACRNAKSTSAPASSSCSSTPSISSSPCGCGTTPRSRARAGSCSWPTSSRTRSAAKSSRNTRSRAPRR